MTCNHWLHTKWHRGESMDTEICLLCGATWHEFYGRNKLGSIFYMPNSQRPKGSQEAYIDSGGKWVLYPDHETIQEDGMPPL